MTRHTHHLLLPFFLFLYAVRAHEHEGELSEEAATTAIDSILWLHIFIQVGVWGVLFPIGMVFGISRSRWHAPLQVSPTPFSSPFPSRPTRFYHDGPSSGPNRSHSPIGCRHRAHARWFHTRARAWGSGISPERAQCLCERPPRANFRSARAGCVSQAAHPRADTAALGRARARGRRKVIPGAWMDPDAIWRDRVPRVLSRRRARAVSCALYHGASVSPYSSLPRERGIEWKIAPYVFHFFYGFGRIFRVAALSRMVSS